ncbi:MAG: nitroreductase family deazaflavin-dependent oxidoreductase [Chloroflexota bacterium]|nr:nitroreductase family deazaflavin-dependent oxidoreductase [Chloroflexota bacterium]
MTVEVTPQGTRGAGFPRLLRTLMRLGSGFMVRNYRRRGTDLRINGQPLILLTTIGAKSGERRQVLVSRFQDGGSETSWLVTGTAGGSATHPAWFLNLAKNPDKVWVEVDGQEMHVRPEGLQGEERDAAWRQIVALAPSFGGYPVKTDRQIPVVRLTAVD